MNASAPTRRLSVLPWLLAGLSICPHLAAQEIPPPACDPQQGRIDNDGKDALVRAKLLDLLAEATPLSSPSIAQVSAPSSAGEGASLVEGPGFPTLLGFALENNVVTTNQNAVTFNINPFAFAAFARPRVLDSAVDYARYAPLRRVGATLTFGGKGEAFDRDGDGQADPALEAKDHDDIVTWEARWRVFGSRDRRESRNFRRFQEETEAEFQLAHELWVSIVETHGGFRSLLRDNCFDAVGLRELLDRPEVEAEFLRLAQADRDVEAAVDRVNKRIDRSPVVTLVLGGVERDDQFGPGKHTASLRGAIGLGQDRGLTVNLDWAEAEGIGGLTDPTTWKLGTEFSVLWLKGTPIGREDGVKVAFSGAYEMFEDVPGAKHDTNAKLNAKLDFPLAQGIKLPISVTWANHKDLLTSENEIRGHIGFTLSLAEMMKKKSGGG